MGLLVFFNPNVVSEILVIVNLDNSLEFFLWDFNLISGFVNKTENLPNQLVLQSNEIIFSEKLKGPSKASGLFLCLEIEGFVTHKESLDPHD